MTDQDRETVAFEREKQNVSSSSLLQALADGQQIDLKQCTVTGSLDVGRLLDPQEKFETRGLLTQAFEGYTKISFSQRIVFERCIFEESLIFAGPWTEPDSVKVEFAKDVMFNSSTFKAQARFRGSVFNGVASFDGCDFGGVLTLRNAEVFGEAKFRTATFNGYTLFNDSNFQSSARFTNSHFVKGANFAGARFGGHTDFGGVYSSSRAVPNYSDVKFGLRTSGEDESFWRFVKQSATEAGYYQMAGECFYNERCAGLWQKFYGRGFEDLSGARKLLRLMASVRLLPEIVFGKLLFGYGEKPVRVLLASALIILVCAFIFGDTQALIDRGGELTGGYSFLNGLYFSMITFTTLGYGDLFPNPQGIYRIIAMIEALSGASLMALFVVCLSKRFSRG